MELHQCLGWVESQSETPILVVLSALLRNFYWYMYIGHVDPILKLLLIGTLREAPRRRTVSDM
jgi:hypothetical protein